MTTQNLDFTHLINRLLQMIAAFQAQTTEANELLRKHLHLENPMFWRQADISQTGYCGINNSIRYFYHGIGCKVETQNLLIDWDYGFDGRVDGFDLWRLQTFAEDSTNDFPELRDKAILEFVYREAIDQKFIHQPFLQKQDSLFYLINVK